MLLHGSYLHGKTIVRHHILSMLINLWYDQILDTKNHMILMQLLSKISIKRLNHASFGK